MFSQATWIICVWSVTVKAAMACTLTYKQHCVYSSSVDTTSLLERMTVEGMLTTQWLWMKVSLQWDVLLNQHIPYTVKATSWIWIWQETLAGRTCHPHPSLHIFPVVLDFVTHRGNDISHREREKHLDVCMWINVFTDQIRLTCCEWIVLHSVW